MDEAIHVVCGPRVDAALRAGTHAADGWRVIEEIPLDASSGVVYTQGEAVRRYAVSHPFEIPSAPASEPWTLFILTRETPP